MEQIGAVVLAAGMARRMGAPKQLLELDGKPLCRYAVETALAASLAPVVVVVGASAGEVAHRLRDLPVQISVNEHYAEGLSTSLRTGVTTIADRVDAVCVFLADQPFTPVSVVAQLVEAYCSAKPTGATVVRPRYAGVPGHPVLFDAAVFPELIAANGDEGARRLLARRAEEIIYVDFAELAWGLDIDTPDDWRTAMEYAAITLRRAHPWRHRRSPK